MKWKPGDIAICIKVGSIIPGAGEDPPVRLNFEYHVHAVNTCECGRIKLDIGIGSRGVGIICYCGAKSSPKSGIWWCASERFVKKDLRSKEEQIAEAIENEDYELASKLSATDGVKI